MVGPTDIQWALAIILGLIIIPLGIKPSSALYISSPNSEIFQEKIPVSIGGTDVINPAPVGEYVSLDVFVVNNADVQEKVDVLINAEPWLEIKPSSSVSLVVPEAKEGLWGRTRGSASAKFLLKTETPGDYVITVFLIYKGVKVGQLPVSLTFSRKGKLTLRIVDSFDGSAVTDADVYAWPVAYGEYWEGVLTRGYKYYEAKAAISGDYELIVPCGEYYLKVKRGDYENQWRIKIAEDTSLTIKIDAGGFARFIAIQTLLLSMPIIAGASALYLIFRRLKYKKLFINNILKLEEESRTRMEKARRRKKREEEMEVLRGWIKSEIEKIKDFMEELES
jgi:hypothetical protein